MCNLEVQIIKWQRKKLPSICLKLHNEIFDYFPVPKEQVKIKLCCDNRYIQKIRSAAFVRQIVVSINK